MYTMKEWLAIIEVIFDILFFASKTFFFQLGKFFTNNKPLNFRALISELGELKTFKHPLYISSFHSCGCQETTFLRLNILCTPNVITKRVVVV